jgi:hypothetical protein
MYIAGRIIKYVFTHKATRAPLIAFIIAWFMYIGFSSSVGDSMLTFPFIMGIMCALVYLGIELFPVRLFYPLIIGILIISIVGEVHSCNALFQ